MPLLIPAAIGVIGIGAGYFTARTESTVNSALKGAVVLGAALYLYKRFK